MNTEVTMRYGCNPHQTQARCHLPGGELPLEVLNDAPSYINLMDALNSWQLVRELRRATGLPAAASFKHVSPAGAAVGIPLPEPLRRALFVPRGVRLTPLACAYARARGADRLASYGDWIALSDTVDAATAELIRVEVSDGVVAPGYDPEALAILQKKRGGSYKVLRIDPGYQPEPMETRQLFGLSMEQRRNDFVPGGGFPEQRGYAAQRPERRRGARPDRRHRRRQVHAVEFRLSRQGGAGYRSGGRPAVAHSLRPAGRGKGGQLVPLRQHPRVLDLEFRRGIRRPERDNAVDLFLQDELAQGTLSAAERHSWERNFSTVPEPLSGEEKREWLAGLKGVALSSDAYFPFRDNIDRASRTRGVEFIVADRGDRNGPGSDGSRRFLRNGHGPLRHSAVPPLKKSQRRQPAAVDGKGHSRYPGSVVGGEEDAGPADVAGQAGAAAGGFFSRHSSICSGVR